MKIHTLGLFLFSAILVLSSHVEAQLANVQTPGLTSGLCAKATGLTIVQNVGCAGQTKVINSGQTLTLSNSDCGAYIMGNGSVPTAVTLPSLPVANCTFTFDSGYNFYIATGVNTPALLPGYDEALNQFTIPVDYLTNGYYTIQYNGQNWKAAEYSQRTHEIFNPFDGAQSTNGQIYFQWDAANSRFEVLQRNGPGGLLVDSRMLGLPSQEPNGQEIWTLPSSTVSNALNYFYVRRPASGEVPMVTGVSGTVGQPITLTLSTTNGASAGDQIWMNCFNINGTIEANGIWTGTVIDSTDVSLNNSVLANQFQSSPDAECMTAQIAVSTTGHITSSQGVEILDTGTAGDVHWTLVGMCYIGANQTAQDTSTHRDCSSWYNRGLKTCVNKFTIDHTTNSTSYTDVAPEIECEFVTWGSGDPGGTSDLSWSISGMMSNDTALDGVAVSAGFGPSGFLSAETEQTASINGSTPASGFSLAVTGSKSGLTEGLHTITLLGKAITGGTAKIYGTTPATSLEVRIPQ